MAAKSPRQSKTIKFELIDLQRPFSSTKFVFENFGSNIALITALETARNLGARTLVIEEIEPAEGIEYENSEISRRVAGYKMTGLRRITFWSSRRLLNLKSTDLNPRSCLGYIIVKRHEAPRLENRWHIYESVFKPPFSPTAVVPKSNNFFIRCDEQEIPISGVMFCGQDGLSKSCAHTNLRSIASLALNRDVTFTEILSQHHLKERDPVHGMTAQDIYLVLDNLGVHYTASHFDKKEFQDVEQFILPAISAGSGALIAFPVSDGTANHIMFTYGYTFDPTSVDYLTSSIYFRDKKQLDFRSITHWIGNYICNDDNLGAYFYLPKYSPVLRRSMFALSILAHHTKYSCREAQLIGGTILSSLTNELQSSSNFWIQKLITAIKESDVVTHATLLSTNEYISYLTNLRDWSRSKEDPEIIKKLAEHINSKTVWVIEFSIPELIPSLQKLGEILLLADASISTDDLGHQVTGCFIMARFPSFYFFQASDGCESSVFKISSKIQAQTPFIESNNGRKHHMQNYDYDVALSFAGEDRLLVEDVADLLKSKNIRVFYDKYEKAQLWGKDLYQHLQGVYRDRANYCVIFISNSYAEKLWTKHELKQAQARAFQENQEYILPVRIDDTSIPGINDTTGYLDLREENIDTLVGLIIEKLNLA